MTQKSKSTNSRQPGARVLRKGNSQPARGNIKGELVFRKVKLDGRELGKVNGETGEGRGLRLSGSQPGNEKEGTRCVGNLSTWESGAGRRTDSPYRVIVNLQPHQNGPETGQPGPGKDQQGRVSAGRRYFQGRRGSSEAGSGNQEERSKKKKKE